MKYRPPVSFEESSTCHAVSDGPDAGGEEATVLQFRFGLLEARREDHVDLPAVVHRHGRAVSIQEVLREVERDVVLRVVVAAGKPEIRAVARAPLEALPAADRDAAQRAALRQEHAVQVAELPVPRRRSRCGHERERDAAAARTALRTPAPGSRRSGPGRSARPPRRPPC